MKHSVLSIFIIFIALPSWGAEFYRDTPPPFRFMGSDQGNVGSCEAEADVAALESVFWELGHTVELSSFHRHQFNWMDDDDISETSLVYSQADRDMLAKLGGVIPGYMMPDRTFGYNPFNTGLRLGVSRMAVVDPAYKAFAVTKNHFTFAAGWANTRTLDDMKKEIAANKAVTLSFSPKILSAYETYSDKTGLLKKGVDIAEYGQFDSTHSVSVIGYDDALYADYGFSRPGALIIKNSWNDEGRIVSALDPNNPAPAEELAKMRGKISSSNLPGYYAIPYALIDAFVANKKHVGYKVLTMDYHGFANQYDQLEKNYEVIKAPFMCGFPSPVGVDFTIPNTGQKLIMNFGKLMNQAMFKQTNGQDYGEESDQMMDIIQDQMSTSTVFSSFGKTQFSYAFLPRHAGMGVDRVKEFYQGAFNDYYCFPEMVGMNTPDHIYPSIRHYENPDVYEAITDFSDDVYSFANWFIIFQTLYNMEANYVESKPSS